jgi:hypothetical protein
LHISDLVKEAAYFGLAVGVIGMAAYLLYFYGRYLIGPAVAIAEAVAEMPKPPFGFEPSA